MADVFGRHRFRSFNFCQLLTSNIITPSFYCGQTIVCHCFHSLQLPSAADVQTVVAISACVPSATEDLPFQEIISGYGALIVYISVVHNYCTVVLAITFF